MTVSIDGTAGITTPAVTSSGTDEAATQTQGGVAMPRMVLSTAQNTTSGTSIDFTSIPSWVKRITLMLNGVSTNGASYVQVQIGAGSVTTTGYSSQSTILYATNSGGVLAATSGFVFNTTGATVTRFGATHLTLLSTNIWVCDAVFGDGSSGGGGTVAGSVTLSGTLDRVRLTTVNGTDTFDAGSVNILYEG